MAARESLKERERQHSEVGVWVTLLTMEIVEIVELSVGSLWQSLRNPCMTEDQKSEEDSALLMEPLHGLCKYR